MFQRLLFGQLLVWSIVIMLIGSVAGVANVAGLINFILFLWWIASLFASDMHPEFLKGDIIPI